MTKLAFVILGGQDLSVPTTLAKIKERRVLVMANALHPMYLLQPANVIQDFLVTIVKSLVMKYAVVIILLVVLTILVVQFHMVVIQVAGVTIRMGKHSISVSGVYSRAPCRYPISANAPATIVSFLVNV